MNDGPRRLARHLAAHQRHVLTVSAGSFLVVAALWAMVYGGLEWIILLLITIGNPAEAAEAHLPASYPVWFLAGAIAWVGAIALATWQRPAARPRDGLRWELIALDFLLLLPRATVGAVQNLTALQPLSRAEIACAWALLQRCEEERHLPLTALPREIPRPRARGRILRALQFSELLELRERDREWVLTLRGPAAHRLLGPRFRLR